MRIVSKTILDTNGHSGHSVDTWSKWVLIWVCFGPGLMMLLLRQFSVERITCKMPWRKMEHTGQIASKYLDLISLLTQIWSHGFLRSIWAHRWLVIHRWTFPSNPTWFVMLSTLLELKDLIAKRNHLTRSSIEWKDCIINLRSKILVTASREQVSHQMDWWDKTSMVPNQVIWCKHTLTSLSTKIRLNTHLYLSLLKKRQISNIKNTFARLFLKIREEDITLESILQEVVICMIHSLLIQDLTIR